MPHHTPERTIRLAKCSPSAIRSGSRWVSPSRSPNALTAWRSDSREPVTPSSSGRILGPASGTSRNCLRAPGTDVSAVIDNGPAAAPSFPPRREETTMATHAHPDEFVEQTTAAAIEEKAKLQKHFGRFDMFFFLICTLVGLDTLGAVSSYGAHAFTWLAVLGVFFFVPYALLTAELGSTFHEEG